MARIFITGSADGLGLLAARKLLREGHRVVLHARHANRAEHALQQAPQADAAVYADLANVAEVRNLAEHLPPFDAILHNAGIYRSTGRELFTVNVLAPYLLTRLTPLPRRLIYLSSGMHRGGHAALDTLTQHIDRISYSDSKLYVTMLAMAVAHKHPAVLSNAVDPGWVPTKMGGPNAPDDLEKGYETQAWLAVSNDPSARVSGRYFFHQREQAPHPDAQDVALQEKLWAVCAKLTGLPEE